MTQISDFIKAWSNKGDEVGNKATYWDTLLRFLGVPQKDLDDGTFIDYEKSIKLNSVEHFHGSIDAYIPSTRVLIEQKSFGVDLFKPENRPNGGHTEKITPYEQARRYDNNLPNNEKARYLVLCNFSQIVVYDVRTSLDVKPYIIELKDLKHDLSRLNFLVDLSQNQHLEKEKRVSLAAGELVGKIYNELLKIYAQYGDPTDPKITRSINALCVRLVFCLYAEDAGLFNDHEQFYSYLKDVAPNKIGLALKALFKVLDTKDRTKDDPFFEAENPELAAFPYVNGGLFHDTDVIIPPFTPELKHILLDEASQQFDWSDISPTIFGAVFESTLNPDTRRQGGMHYTSVKNIHKVIDPLFLNDLKADLQAIKDKYDQKGALTKWQKKALAKDTLAFQDKLSKLTFMDPACGSGNFLTETYLSLRKLENEAIRMRTMGESILDMGDKDIIQVSIQQFFGIEINDFAVSVAKTALWIAEDQMMKETQDLIAGAEWDFLPLQSYNHIHEGNALKIDWNEIIPNYACHYIISNPPFVGARLQSKDQKADVKRIFNNKKGSGNIDYVACWYRLASQYMLNTKVRASFVSTNSITQGEQVALVWEDLFKNKDFHINFAYKTFIWDSDTRNKAHVHVVIIGFSYQKSKEYLLFKGNEIVSVDEINPYLIASKPVFIHDRKEPLEKDQKKLIFGSMPNDGGHLSRFSQADADAITKQYPTAKDLFKQLIGSAEFINNRKRYCLWLYHVDPAKYAKTPPIMGAIKAVKKMRESSSRKATQNLAAVPYLFGEIRQPESGSYIVIPRVSSQRREYIPIGFEDHDIIANDSLLIIPNATKYDFGILESKVHMVWMRVVAGRLKSDYRYSAKIVYNNFPWPKVAEKEQEQITKTADAILQARQEFPDSSLATLYDPLLMQKPLRKAHEANDRAVLSAYGLKADSTDEEIMHKLLTMYEKLAQKA